MYFQVPARLTAKKLDKLVAKWTGTMKQSMDRILGARPTRAVVPTLASSRRLGLTWISWHRWWKTPDHSLGVITTQPKRPTSPMMLSPWHSSLMIRLTVKCCRLSVEDYWDQTGTWYPPEARTRTGYWLYGWENLPYSTIFGRFWGLLMPRWPIYGSKGVFK